MSTATASASQEPWTIRRVLTWTTEHFTRKDIDSPRLATEVLLAFTLKTDRVRLYVDLDRPLSKDELAAFKALIERRVQGEPTQYLVGKREFYNRAFAVDPRVLIPRPETELLVEAVLHAIPKDVPSRVLDLCTGSGCIGITIAAERPLCEVTAVDVSAEACAVARANAKALGVEDRVRLLEGDLFSALPGGSTDKYLVVVSNPPYIASGEIAGLAREVQREPLLALDGGADGLLFLKRIVTGAREHLLPGGWLALELGEKQGNAVRGFLVDAGYEDVRIEKDLARLDRLALGVVRSTTQA